MSAAEVRALPLAEPLDDPAMLDELTQRYLIFDPFVAGERRVDLHPLVLPVAEHRAAMHAAEQAVRTIGAVAARAHDDEGEARRYRLPPGVRALAAACHRAHDEATLVRVDLLRGADGQWQVCELNVDCPGGHNEAMGLPRLAQRSGGAHLWNPTTVVEATARRLVELARGDAVALAYATGYADDLQVCALLERAIGRLGGKARRCSPIAPRRRDGRLRVKGDAVGALYRFFPVEGMEDQKNVPDLLDAIASGELRTLSSFAGAFAQSKTAMARAWATLDTLGEAERAWLTAHLPLTLEASEMPAPALLADRAGWVLKKGLGRVGDEVFVGALMTDEAWAEVVTGVAALEQSGDQAWIAQRYVPQASVPTPWGPRLATLGVYVLDGRFAGYFARLTIDSHVSHDALCVPVLVEVAP